MPKMVTFSLKREFFKKTTILSLALAAFLIYLFFSRAAFGDVARHLGRVEPFFLVLAFASHYLSYLVRGYRWKRMLEPAGFSGGTIGLAKIIFLFQAVDSALPGKVGDLYGAHLMKLNFSMSRSFSLGSLLLWRFVDLLVLVGFAGGAAFVLFGNRVPPQLLLAMKVAGVFLVVLLVAVGVFLHSHKWFPMKSRSERLRSLFDSFRGGLRLKGKIIPVLLTTTIMIWLLEATRLFFVCKSLAVGLGVIPILFVAFSTTLFTAIPLTPSGLGAVELGMLKLLAFVGVGNVLAYPLIIWDRFIAHWSQVLLGMVVIVFSRAINLKIWHFEEDTVPAFEKEPSLS